MQVLHDTFVDDPSITTLSVHWSDREDPSEYLAAGGFTFPVVRDGTPISAAYGVPAMPTFLVVGPDGSILDRHLGRLTDEVRDRLASTARAAAADNAG